VSAQSAKTPTVQSGSSEVLRRLDSFPVPLIIFTDSICFSPPLKFRFFYFKYVFYFFHDFVCSLLINQMEASNNGFSRGTKVELVRLRQRVKEDFQRFDFFFCISLFCLIYFQCFMILALDPLIFGLTVSGFWSSEI